VQIGATKRGKGLLRPAKGGEWGGDWVWYFYPVIRRVIPKHWENGLTRKRGGGYLARKSCGGNNTIKILERKGGKKKGPGLYRLGAGKVNGSQKIRREERIREVFGSFRGTCFMGKRIQDDMLCTKSWKADSLRVQCDLGGEEKRPLRTITLELVSQREGQPKKRRSKRNENLGIEWARLSEVSKSVRSEKIGKGITNRSEVQGGTRISLKRPGFSDGAEHQNTRKEGGQSDVEG